MLVLLNAKLLLDAFAISDDITATVLTHQKLSLPPNLVTPDNAGITMVWAAPAVVAMACGDDRLRAFDLRHDDAFMIPLPMEGTHVTNIASDLNKNILTIGDAEGTLVVFQKANEASAGGHPISLTGNALPTAQDPALGWEASATHKMAARIDRIVCTSLGDMITCVDGKQLQVLHETVRKRDWDGVAAATQISSDMVVVESVTGCQCLLHSNTKVRGLSISFPMIVLWDGTQLFVYTINEATSEFSLTRSVPTTSPVFSAHPDGLFYVKEDRIIYATWQMEPLGQLAFTEAEGAPMLLDVMCDFVVAVSTKNVLRLAKVSSRDMRPLGPSRPLNLSDATLLYVPPSGNPQEMEQVKADVTEPVTVVAARVNAQGRRVALMTKVGALGKPDSRIWVFDSDTDKAYCYDFAGRSEIPDAVYWNTPEPNANSIGELEYLLLACETHEIKAGHPAGPGAGKESGAGGDGDAGHHKGRQPLRQEDLPGALPDMQNFAEAAEGRRGSIGVTNFLGNRSHNLVTLFATHKGLVLHNSVSLKEYQICLVGLTIPDFLLASIKINGDPTNAEDYVIEQKRLRDFDGLKSDKDVVVREALLKFSYYATIGNMDEAYRCIKTIKNPAAWHGLARMCVSNGRLDVAAVCLATMQDGVAARLLRESKEEHPYDKNVQLATLACSLKMMDEAEHLLRLSQRYDLITDVYLACGKFEQAQRHSQRFDRIRIRPVAYKYAQFMESLQNMDAAIMWYFNARCAGTDVPRVFFQTNRLHELRELMLNGQSPNQSQTQNPNPNPNQGQNQEGGQEPSAAQGFEDPQSTFSTLFPSCKDLLQWWAQYSERRRNMPEAIRFYECCDDTYNMVRILCSVKPPKLENAVDLVEEEINDAKAKYDQYQAMAAVPGDSSNGFSEPERVGAAYFVGKHYEATDDVDTALKYYRHAGAYRSGVRVARKAERDTDVVALALASKDERLILDMAIYLEKKESFDKAVELYREVDATQLALDVCIRGGLYDTLHEISTKLANAKTDPEVFMNMANHFQTIGQYQKTVEMLVFAKKYDDALRMCEERNVILTDEMAEAMTGENNVLPADEKVALLKRVAHTAKDQGSWTLACKKYTQAGERVKALKMLMRGGEVEKVIFFTNHSRSTEIYTLAANYLQSQNWSTDVMVYKSIVQFYTKAKVFDSLFSFYDSCAQFRIDEDRDYRQALNCIEDCVRAMEKANANRQNVNMTNVAGLKEKGKIIASVVQAKQISESIDPQRRGNEDEKKKSDEVIAICSDLIKRSRPNHDDHTLIEDAIRIGDVFALLVKFYMEKLDEPKSALKVLESMPKHGIEPQYFVEVEYMEKVCKANDKRLRDVVTISSAAMSTKDARRRSSGVVQSSVLDEVMK
ncbi:Intraflagellar Transport Protein 140 [Strigomonas culicis]|uniref:Intraflagellar Transport Protein 140 n=1 Tax=Strigomonas culicis TaxID=28005 RepID=S9VQF5_9TRYP|nr:Intraflagellar Transport Protein 140 [Strigomonas culicis]|eukprot:EPY29346.1 Intraflagellar Transport Protein 140 [Strigomonas culicis]